MESENNLSARGIRHALTGHVYRPAEGGKVLVVDEEGGRRGTFTRHGEWVSGDLKSADPFLCVWIENKGREADYRHPLAGKTTGQE